MPHDIFVERRRCTYCERPASVIWDDDLFSCSEEVCKTLAFAETRRRQRRRLSRGGSAALRRSSGRSARAPA